MKSTTQNNYLQQSLERFEKTTFARAGGSCWEVCDYEAITKDLKSFLTQELKAIIERGVEEIKLLPHIQEQWVHEDGVKSILRKLIV